MWALTTHRLSVRTALANGVTLVTRNIKEFGRIDALRQENWFELRRIPW